MSKPDLRSLGRTPFYQEFTVTFSGEALGLEVIKSCDCPVVRRLVRQNARFIGPAEKGGVSIGSLLVAVGPIPTIALGYDECLRRIQSTPRPMDLTFRRIHACKDPAPFHGRLWQGFLRVFQNGHWTGRFYMLRCNGKLQAFAGTAGDSLESPVDELSVVGCTVLSGASARAAAPEPVLIAEGSGQVHSKSFWENVFALHNGNGSEEEQKLVLFRANDVDQRIEWVSALATFQIIDPVDHMALWAPLSALKQGYADRQQGGNDAKQALVGGLLTASSASQPRQWKRVWLVLTKDSKLQWFEQAPMNVFELPLGQLLLWSVKVESAFENENELESASVSVLPNVDTPVTEDVADASPTSFLLHAGTRSLSLRFGTTDEAREWRLAITSATVSKTDPLLVETENASIFTQRLTALRLHPKSLLNRPDLSYSLMAGGADRISNKGEDSATTSDASVVLRSDFVTIAGQYFLPMCDAFCASVIFDALTSFKSKLKDKIKNTTHQSSVGVSTPSTLSSSPGMPSGIKSGTPSSSASASISSSSSSMAIARSFLESVSGTGNEKKKLFGVDDRVTRIVTASPLSVGVALGRDIWGAYCAALRRETELVESWEQLRVKLGLEPSEVLVRMDTRATAVLHVESIREATNASSTSSSSTSRLSWTDVGTTFLTNRNLVFLQKGNITSIRGFETMTNTSRPIAHVIPIISIQAVRESLTNDGGRLIIEGARVLTAKLHEQVVSEEGDVRVVLGFSEGGRLFSTPKRSSGGSGVATSRQLFREALVELVAAHRIASSVRGEQQRGGARLVGTGTSEHWRRGAGAMKETLKAALALGPRELWKRKGVAEPTEQEMWHLTVTASDLTLWCAAMLKRRAALIACTGRPTSQLLVCTRFSESAAARATLRAFLSDASRHHDAQNKSSSLVACKGAALVETVLPTEEDGEEGVHMEWSCWIPILSEWLTHQEKRRHRDLEVLESLKLLHGCPSFETGRTLEDRLRLTAAYTTAFHPSTFRDEWQLFMGFVDPFVDNVVDVLPGTHVHRLLHWDDPLLSASVLLFLLSIAWHDLVHLVPSLLLLSAAAVVLATGSTVNAATGFKNAEELAEAETLKVLKQAQQLEQPQNQERFVEACSPQQFYEQDAVVGDNESIPKGMDPIDEMPSEDDESETPPALLVASNSPRNERDPESSMTKESCRRAPNPIDLGVSAAEDLDDDQVMALAAAAAAKNINEQLLQKQFQHQQQQHNLWDAVGSFDANNLLPSNFFQAAPAEVDNARTKENHGLKDVQKGSVGEEDNEEEMSEEEEEQVVEDDEDEEGEDDKDGDENKAKRKLVGRRDANHNKEDKEDFAEGTWREQREESGEGGVARSLSTALTSTLSSSLAAGGVAPAVVTPLQNQQLPQPDGEQESLLTFMRQMRAHLGRMQLHLHRYNTYLLRAEALMFWRDLPSTAILLLGLTAAAVWLAVIPNNCTFALASLYSFARPIRFPVRAPGQPPGRRSMGDTLLDQWLDGIPLEDAPTHRNVAIAVQRALVADPKN